MSDKFTVIPGGAGKEPALPDIPLPPPIKPDIDLQAQREKEFANFLETCEVTYDYKRNGFRTPKGAKQLGQMARLLRVRCHVYDQLPWLGKDLDTYLELYRETQSQRVVSNIMNSLPPYDPEAIKVVRAWVDMVSRESEKGREYTTLMIQQWVWQVRRAMLGKRRRDQIMLVWQGKEGVGKSSTIERFLAPISPLWKDKKLNNLTDDRHYCDFERHYAMYVGELKGEKWNNLSALKNNITAHELSYRVLATHTVETVDQNCSFIADTNYGVASIFKDRENRRFWEIRFKPRQEIDLGQIIEFPDFHLFWACADYDNERSPLEVSGRTDLIRAAQADELGTQDPVTQWREEAGLKTGKHKVAPTELYDAYKKWAIPRQLPTGNIQWFGNEMGNAVQRKKARREGGAPSTFYLCNVSPTELKQ